MVLTYNDIEIIAAAVLSDFGGKMPLDVNRLAQDYLGLSICWQELSTEGTALGLTTYEEADIEINHRIVHFPANSLIIERELLERSRHDFAMLGRMRYTIAHECSHQILIRLDPTTACQRTRNCERRTYSFRELKSRGDWNEWQANALAAALLMPPDEILKFLQRKIFRYGWRLTQPDQLALYHLTHKFHVSNEAMIIRLKQLGLCEQRAEYEYYDPTEVQNDNEKL